MGRTSRLLLVLCLTTTILSRQGSAAPIRVPQGKIVRLVVKPDHPQTTVRGRFNKQPIPFFKRGDGRYAALIGIDMDLPPNTYRFTASWKAGGKVVRREYPIEVVSADFPTQTLTLPKGMVDLSPKTLARVKREKGRMRDAFSQSAPERLWTGAFIAPVKGKRQGTFGRRRILNGQPRRPHTGEDITAPIGAPVAAANGGRVVLVGDFFFNGRSVVIDHGLGLFSMYFHLSEIAVKEGERVNRGGLIGRVGASGRVTGPHLHWGARLNGARIDPFSLVNQPMD